MKNKLASRYSVQKSVFTKKVKTAEDNAVAYLEMMKEITKKVILQMQMQMHSLSKKDIPCEGYI